MTDLFDAFVAMEEVEEGYRVTVKKDGHQYSVISEHEDDAFLLMTTINTVIAMCNCEVALNHRNGDFKSATIRNYDQLHELNNATRIAAGHIRTCLGIPRGESNDERDDN